MAYIDGFVMPDWLTRRAQSDPSETAIWHPDGERTYLDLYKEATQLAGQLMEEGVSPGERVAILARHGLLFARCVHASMEGGYPVVPLNARLSANELAYQLDDASAVVLLYDDAFSDLAFQAAKMSRQSLRLVKVDLEPAPVTTAKPVNRETIDLREDLCIIYTSGTTGNPKGARLSYGNFFWSAMGSSVALGLSRQENWLVPMPLFHVGGLSVLIRSVIYGTRASVMDKFNEDEVNHLLDTFDITLISVVPTMLSRMLARRGERPYKDTLRTVLLGGSAADETLLTDCQRLGVPVAQTYGLTEATSQVCTLPIRDSLRKLGSSGKPLLPTEVRIIDENTNAVPAGVVGEIAVRGPTLSSGYLNHKPRNKALSGWFLTGDIGYLDDEGYLYVLDRRSDMFVSGGENVYPAEVEKVLMAHGSVVEAGVVGADHPTWGQVPVAFVRLFSDSTVTSGDLTKWCEKQLAKYKVPRQFRIVDELPRNASGKLLRRTLRQWL